MKEKKRFIPSPEGGGSSRREIIKIDEEKCTGCGLCVPACAEGAIQIVNGKARLVSEIYCDGLGACLGECPEGAITIEEREAAAFDEEATKVHLQHITPSQLANWPVQLSLVSPAAPYFQDADLLLAADCVPFALADFHARYLRGKTVVIGCPKLDDANYYIEKLSSILRHSSINSLTVVHMEVPCCSGLNYIASRAIQSSGKDVPLSEVVITIQGEVMAYALSQI